MSSSLSLSKVIKPRAGWYRGDFHAHTNFSDGYYSPSDLVEVARLEGLDFFAVTDHNTLKAYPNFGDPPDMLIIPGMEVTVKAGHFNVFGLEGTPGWMASVTHPHLRGQYNTMNKLMRQTASEGLLNSMNHPLLEPWEWRDKATDLRYVDCVEIYNDPSWPGNKQAIPLTIDLWTEWLNTGHRITAIGGSDYHRPQPKPGENKPAERLGLPRTYVYAEALSGAAILASLGRRRVYVSMGPEVTFQARTDRRSYDIGADLGEFSGELNFRATIDHCPAKAHARIVKNGQIVSEVLVEKGPTALGYTTQADPTRPAWYRLDVWDQEGQILAITNPIFIGTRPMPRLHRFGDFV